MSDSSDCKHVPLRVGGSLADQRPSSQPPSDRPPNLEDASPTAEDQGPSKFTTREKDVLNLLVQGQANKEIATALCICEKTVEFHLKNIYTKLGVTNRGQAIVKAIQWGIGEN